MDKVVDISKGARENLKLSIGSFKKGGKIFRSAFSAELQLEMRPTRRCLCCSHGPDTGSPCHGRIKHQASSQDLSATGTVTNVRPRIGQ